MPYENVVKLGYSWIPEALYLQIKAVFEPRYKRQLEDKEIVEIADNLVDFTENYSSYKSKRVYGKKSSK